MGLTVTELSCDRSGRPVLGGVTLEIDDGEAVLLRGPNGVGKSTLLRALAGLLPFTGAVSLDGHDLRADRDGYGERLAFAGHLDAIKPQLTVAENLGFWGALFGAASVDAALAEFDLAAIADRPAHACSAGQKRRLGLARLAVTPPPPVAPRRAHGLARRGHPRPLRRHRRAPIAPRAASRSSPPMSISACPSRGNSSSRRSPPRRPPGQPTRSSAAPGHERRPRRPRPRAASRAPLRRRRRPRPRLLPHRRAA